MALAYVPVGRAGFIWDDNVVVTQNPDLRNGFEGLLRLWQGGGIEPLPLTWTLIWLEWQAWGANPLPYHLVNLVLHIVTTLLIWRILVRLDAPLPWLGAALFGLHPVNVATIAWIAEQKSVLSLALAAGSVLAWLQWRTNRGGGVAARLRYATALLLYGAALMAKAAVAPLPLVLLALAAWKEGRIDRRLVLALAPFALCSAFAATLAVRVQAQPAVLGALTRPEGALTRLADAANLLWRYAWSNIAPLDLPIIYPRISADPLSAASWIGLSAWLAVFAVLLTRRATWGRGPMAALLCWIALLAPVLGFVPLVYMRFSLMADHWQYPATAVSMAAVAALLARLPPVPARSLGALLLLAMTALTWRQSALYTDAERLWRAATVRTPTAWIAWCNLGSVCEETGQTEEATACYETCLRLRPDMPVAHVGLGVLRRKEGRLDEAMGHFEAARDAAPDYSLASYHLGVALMAKGRHDAAAIAFARAADLAPDHVEARANLASALLLAGRFDEATVQARRALDARPNDVALMYNLALALERQGRLAEALDLYETILTRGPSPSPAAVRIAWIRATAPEDSLRDGTRALALARAAAAANPTEADALDALAAAEAECGHYRAAVEAAQRAAAVTEGAQRDAIEKRRQTYEGMLPYRSGTP